MIYTIGHSTLSENDFLELIRDIDILMDVRSHPHSVHKHFNIEQLKQWIPANNIKYIWEPRLGGWTERHLTLVDKFPDVNIAAYANSKFPKQHIAKNYKTDKIVWYNVGLLDYSWFTTLPEFQNAAIELIEMGKSINVGYFCCELLWWRCHRSMISDCLWFRGIDTIHLQPKITRHSSVIGNRLTRYDPRIIEEWQKYFK